MWIGCFAVILVVIGLPRLVTRLGIRSAVGFSLLLLVALPASWLPLALLNAVTGWPHGWLSLLLWLALAVVLLALGPRLLPSRLRRVWAILFAPFPVSTFPHLISHSTGVGYSSSRSHCRSSAAPQNPSVRVRVSVGCYPRSSAAAR